MKFNKYILIGIGSLIFIGLIVACNSVNYMRIATFFAPIKDSENLDIKTQITVPDQSLSVRDILQRFTRGTISIPPLDTGEDDDIDSVVNDFDDFVDAHDMLVNSMDSLKNSSQGAPSVEESERSEDTETASAPEDE